MNANFPVFVICVEAIIHLLLYNLHDCTFNDNVLTKFLLKLSKFNFLLSPFFIDSRIHLVEICF